jgi:gamma-glutamyltranspeptidase/glutathione hydrolase
MSTRPDRNREPAFTSTRRPVVAGVHHAVSSMKPPATAAAMRILDAGGNAFDAAVAGQAVLALVDPAMNGIGADAEVLVYDARAGEVLSINGTAPAPALATIAWYRDHHGGTLPTDDGLLVGTVPTVVDVWFTLLDRWGTMTFAETLAPAVEVAERGFPLPWGLATAINHSAKLAKHPTSARVYQPRDWREGDLFANPDAGRLLRQLVEAEEAGRGGSGDRRAGLRAARDRFYTGDIARTMARFAEEQGALFRYDDFAGFTVTIETPVHAPYRGYDVYKNASATQGPAELFALNVLEGIDLFRLDHNGADFIHTSAEAIKLAMADRERYLGDAAFVRIPFEGLLSKAYAADRRALIDVARASTELRPGDPFPFMPAGAAADHAWTAGTGGTARHEGDTSYLAVVDRDRNMVSFEPSLHSHFGTGVVMADLGIIFNCRGDYFRLEPGLANSLLPGKRPRSTLQSTLVLEGGRPFMITGSPGGDDQVMRTMQTLINVVDFGMNVQEAIEAPRWSTRAFPASAFPHTMRPADLIVESRIGPDVQAALRARGHDLEVAPAWSLGANAGIIVDTRRGVLFAGADPRVDAYAEAR